MSLDLPSQLPEPLLTFVFPALSWFECVRLLICDVFWSGEMLFPVYLEDEAARRICSYDIGSPPCFCAGPSGTPPPPGPTAASRVSFQLQKLKVKFLIFLFPALSSKAPLARAPCSPARLTFFRWPRLLTPLPWNVHPHVCWPFQVAVRG